MTVVLITNRTDYTTDFVVLELRRRGVDFLRLNTEDIPTRVKVRWSPTEPAANYLSVDGRPMFLSEIGSIWYRRPVTPMPDEQITDLPVRQWITDETRAAFAGIWRTLDCFWVSHPDKLYAASYKLPQLRLAIELGFRIPHTVVTDIPAEANQFMKVVDNAVYKPVATNRLQSEGAEQLIFTTALKSRDDVPLESVQYAPCTFQQLISKEVDVRVTVIGSRVFAVAIHSQGQARTQIDWRRGEASTLPHSVLELPEIVSQRCAQLVAKLGLQFGAIDLILDEHGEYYFLEINPHGQWAWIEQLTGLPLTATLVDLLT